MVHKDGLAPSQNGAPEPVGSNSSTAEQLLACFQRVEEVWKQAEEKLAATHVPIDVRVMVSDGLMESDQGTIWGTVKKYLGYCKVKGSRRVCFTIEKDFYHEPDYQIETKPITEWPVDIRMEMFDHFPALYAEAEAVAKSYIPRINQAIEKFEATLLLIDI